MNIGCDELDGGMRFDEGSEDQLAEETSTVRKRSDQEEEGVSWEIGEEG